MECIPYIPITENDWDSALMNCWKLWDAGFTLPLNDILIASIALSRDLRVYARDKHFETLSTVLGLPLYRPGYGGSYHPG